MKHIWTARAERDLLEIGRYISRHSPIAARRWVTHLRRRAREAVDHPQLGRKVPEFGHPDIRELLHGNYRIVYRLGDDRIEVITVFEGHKRLSREP